GVVALPTGTWKLTTASRYSLPSEPIEVSSGTRIVWAEHRPQFVIEVLDHGAPVSGAQASIWRDSEQTLVGPLTDRAGRATITPMHGMERSLLAVCKRDYEPAFVDLELTAHERDESPLV